MGSASTAPRAEGDITARERPTPEQQELASLGLKVAAKLHLGAAIGNADPVVEFTGIMIHELLLKDELQLKDGYLDIPTAPGLGMALNDEKIEALRTPGIDV